MVRLVNNEFLSITEWVSELSWCFFKQDYLLFASRGRLIEMFILGTLNIGFGEKLERIGEILLFS